MKIVVIGGTGLIGSKLVKKLREHGHEAVAASPDTGVNTMTGQGLAEALQGASVVVDVSNSPSFEDAAVHGVLHDVDAQPPRTRRQPRRGASRRVVGRGNRALSEAATSERRSRRRS